MRNWIAGALFWIGLIWVVSLAQEINWTMANIAGILTFVGAILYITKRERK